MRRAVVTGGAGFLGSHLCEELLAQGWQVLAVDNLLTGYVDNVRHLVGLDDFHFLEWDACMPVDVQGPVDAVLHFASPASPKDYLTHPIETLKAGSIGTTATLDLAVKKGAQYLLASTSEVYGDPRVHPQPETYWGNVNPVGPRSVYDEAKRFAEALAMAYHRTFDLDVKIVRIFNTYGPRLSPGDGRAIPNFLEQALRGESLTVYGDGTQTRSLCYVDDEVRGILALLQSDWVGPMNIGNPDEWTMLDLASFVLRITGSDSSVAFEPLPVDDPVHRCPDISVARRVLGWQPTVELSEGLTRTADWIRAAPTVRGVV